MEGSVLQLNLNTYKTDDSGEIWLVQNAEVYGVASLGITGVFTVKRKK